ncbi:F-box and WD repeat domain containing 5 [Aphomia sociella]
MASAWQEARGCDAVLREVFARLDGAGLARAAAACRAWRRRAADPGLWRRLLRARVTAAALAAMRRHPEFVSWRQEYVNLHAEWKMQERLLTTSEAPLLCATLAQNGHRLAITAEDASVAIWTRNCNGKWVEEFSVSMRARGWASVARAQWAAHDTRLLIAGPLALADRWELLVLQLDDSGGYRVISRAGCSAGAAGCWARSAGDVFLSLEMRRLAPRQACTTIWLNAATQEIQSEYAGVTAPILRIYNEESAHITHALVAEVPLEEPVNVNTLNLPDEYGNIAPSDAYYRATSLAGNMLQKRRSACSVHTLLAVSCGEAGLLRSWALSALQPPPLLAAALGDLRARMLAHRARAAAAAAAAPRDERHAPDEAAVRALCSPPDAQCRLRSVVAGLVLHPSSRCAWASTADARVHCVSLPALLPLCCARAAAACAPPTDHHYIQPALSEQYVACPAGGRSGRVWLWSAASGASLPAAPAHDAPALWAALPPAAAAPAPAPAPAPATLLVLTADALHVWQNTATLQPLPYEYCDQYIVDD